MTKIRCKHCNGTGFAKETATLECIGCQCKVRVTYETTEELCEVAPVVRCADCRSIYQGGAA